MFFGKCQFFNVIFGCKLEMSRNRLLKEGNGGTNERSLSRNRYRKSFFLIKKYLKKRGIATHNRFIFL